MTSGSLIIKKETQVLPNLLFPDVGLLSGIRFLLLKISYQAVGDKGESGFHLLLIWCCVSSEPWAACSFSYLARIVLLCKRPEGDVFNGRRLCFYLSQLLQDQRWFPSQDLWLHSDGKRASCEHS